MKQIIVIYISKGADINLVRYDIQQPPAIINGGNCMVTFSVVVQTNQIDLKSENFSSNYSLSNTVNSRGAGSTSLFIFQSVVNSVTRDSEFNLQLNITDTTSAQIYPFMINGFKCLDQTINKLNVTFIGEPTMISNTMTVNLEVDFGNDVTGDQYISCMVTNSLSITNCYYRTINSMANSGFIVMEMNPGFTTPMPSFLLVELTYITFSTTINITNVFPYNVTRTSVIEEKIFYPFNQSIVHQDYQLNSYNLYNLMVVKNPNSYFTAVTPPPATTQQPYILVGSNETHSTYLFYSLFTNYTGDAFTTYILDSQSTTEPNRYFSEFYVNPDFFKSRVLKGTSSFDSQTDTILIDISVYVPFLYKNSLTYYSNYNMFMFNSPYPSSNNFTVPGSFNFNYVVPFFKYNTPSNALFTMTPGDDAQVPIIPIISPPFYNVILNDLSWKQLTSYSMLVHINVTSTSCPITYILLSYITILTPSDLIEGDLFSGVYEAVVTVTSYETLELSIQDSCNHLSKFESTVSYNPMKPQTLLPKYPAFQIPISPSNITYFRFLTNDLDLSNGDVNVTLHFNVTNPEKDVTPSFVFKIFQIQNIGAYDANLDLYVINFTVSSNMPAGAVEYYLIWVGYSLQTNIMNSYFGSQAALRIKKSSCDYVPPMIISADPLPGNSFNLNTENDNAEIGWTLQITDSSGFVNGTIQIISDLDPLPRILTINDTNRTGGDQKNGNYTIKFNVSGRCRSQTFKLTNATLYDTNKQNAYLFINTFDSLSPIYGTIGSSATIKINCLTSIQDQTAPTLKSLSMTPVVDVGGLDRLVYINFTTGDELGGSNVSLRHNPVAHLLSENGNFIEITSTLLSQTANANGEYSYMIKQQLPFGFGLTKIIVNIYGFVDNFNNYRSYTSINLRDSGFSYYINRSFTTNQPILESSSGITNRGGSLTINGRSFGVNLNNLNSQIDYQDGNGYQNIAINFFSGILLSFDNVKSIQSNFIKIRVIKNGIKSNELTIPVIRLDPLPTTSPNPPTPTPSKCPGTPSCNNNGQCINSICQCYQPWYGPSCSSKNIIVPIPPAYPEPTTGTNITESGSLITTSIEIIGIRELDDINNIVEQFNISNWNFTDQTTPTTNPKYFYSTQINQRSTILNVTIEYFKQSTNITFANQNLFIPQSTIKFTMNLNSYRFKQPTNTLQILMKAAIESDQSDVCSSSGFGSVNGSIQWIKLNVGDQSLYGRFLSDAVIDNTVTPIKNVIIDQDDIDSEQNKQFRSAIVGITIPSYSDSVDLDPDFSNLIDVGSSDTSDFICPKKGLSNGAIAGIVVGGVK
ncbi:EGF-like domain-containing protein [Heterostelium album PN500]|uniref:EGF-like domain-containing protein n=1 Tax=Heterostelium pallidum (strain ATCC 26659 / Pp 5 / PN500) TaxID=670386 RepID=D3BT87_HETP5|nr:EGF-like domain-containing protein [Heterostelium album PN500]EFA75304.1 EGF-like domain-containing protein [Heterostelium album PN500]|eukprot:XP_020427438.1 EGF-like domain-containing protein [Heterostelium album PN500]